MIQDQNLFQWIFVLKVFLNGWLFEDSTVNVSQARQYAGRVRFTGGWENLTIKILRIRNQARFYDNVDVVG